MERLAVDIGCGSDGVLPWWSSAGIEPALRGSLVTDGQPTQPESAAVPVRARDARWSNLWQVPTIVVSLALILGGLLYARSGTPEHDFDGALADVEALLAAGEFDQAATFLREIIQPHLQEATDSHRGKFNALIADMLYLAQEARGGATSATRQSIVDRYQAARQLGFNFGPKRIERWANTLIDLGRLDRAELFVDTLDALTAHEDEASEAELARNRVMRRLVEASLAEPELPFERMMAVLGEYRANPRLHTRDVVWAIAREAELRQHAGLVRESVDRLLVDMRRIEPRLEYEKVNLGELYVLLARGYYQLAEYALAQQQTDRALALLDQSDPVRADAYEIQGRILLARGQFDQAFDAFQTATVDFENTTSFLHALLGRAETHAVLGRHEDSRQDYEALARAIEARSAPNPPKPDVVAKSLIDRHDASLATGQLDLALSYIKLAPAFFKTEMPEAVLLRLASTSRQLAENLLADATGGVGRELDPAVRREASEHYREAANYFQRRARVLRPLPTEDAAWAQSLWNAADCYDLAGYYDLAIGLFNEYIEGRGEEDPVRVEAKFRLARCHQAAADFERAVMFYEQVIAENPRSPLAARSYVPLATSLAALGRKGDAELQLRRVISGSVGLEPEAVEFADALLALGTLHHRGSQYVEAIEELDRFSASYPDDPRLTEAMYRLADSHRLLAQQFAAQLAQNNLPRSRAEELSTERNRHLTEAEARFAVVQERYDARGLARLDQLQQDQLRNALLYRGDCEYELGNLNRAIELYDQAARRYADHPASLVALIQIVNAYVKLGDTARAATAHNRALLRLQQMPERAFTGPDAVLGAEAWEAWLRSLPPGVALVAGNRTN